MNTSNSRLVIRDYPLFWWAFGVIATGVAVYFYWKDQSQIVLAVAVASGLLTLLGPSVVTIIADRRAGTLTLKYQAPFRSHTKEIPIQEIQAIYVDEQISRDDDGVSRTYQVIIRLEDGQEIPLRGYYSSGREKKDARARQLSDFLGAKPASLVMEANMEQAAIFQEEQASITGDLAEEQITDGVRWHLETLAFSRTPVTRWHSPDFSWPDGFLFLSRRIPDLPDLLNIKPLQVFRRNVYQIAAKSAGFSVDDLPHLNRARLMENFDPRFEARFSAFTSDLDVARRILTPWVTRPLLDWTERHPFTRESAQEQLFVLFGPGGFYLVVRGLVNPEYLDELTALGVDLVKSQRNTVL